MYIPWLITRLLFMECKDDLSLLDIPAPAEWLWMDSKSSQVKITLFVYQRVYLLLHGWLTLTGRHAKERDWISFSVATQTFNNHIYTHLNLFTEVCYAKSQRSLKDKHGHAK